MTHYLWTTQDWQNSSLETVVAALFDAPKHIDPDDMAQIKRFYSQAKNIYLNFCTSPRHVCKS